MGQPAFPLAPGAGRAPRPGFAPNRPGGQDDSSGPGRRWVRILAWFLGIYGILHLAFTFTQPFRGEIAPSLLGSLLNVPGGAAAAALGLLVAIITPRLRLRLTWLFIGLGYLAYTGGGLLWAWNELSPGQPAIPLLADLFYVTMYALVAIGLLFYPSVRLDATGRLKMLLDILAITTAATFYSWVFIMSPIVDSGNWSKRLIELVYPLLDLALFTCFLKAYFTLPHGANRRPLLLLGAGIVLYLLGDNSFATLRANSLYYSGHPLDGVWLAGCLTTAAAAMAEVTGMPGKAAPNGEKSLRPSLARGSQVLLPYFAVLAGLVLLAMELLQPRPSPHRWELLLGSGNVLVIVMARQLLTIRENSRLNAQLLSSSKDLERRVSERTEELARKVQEVTALNRQVQTANAELMQIDRLKSEFISNVSHELRTPLTSILGYSELLLEMHAKQVPQQQRIDQLNVIHKNGERLLSLVNDLLDVSRMEAGRFSISPEPMDAAPLFAQLTEESRLVAEQKGLTLIAELPRRLPLLHADGPRLAQVFNNLLSNAIKFTPAKGTVRVGAWAIRSDGSGTIVQSGQVRYHLTGIPSGEWLVVGVQDSGIGISPPDQIRLFTRFYRAPGAQRAAVQGTGIGLYLARTVVEAHGGRIGVQSSPSRGSFFWFAIPALED